jgi:hypothetical protein
MAAAIMLLSPVQPIPTSPRCSMSKTCTSSPTTLSLLAPGLHILLAITLVRLSNKFHKVPQPLLSVPARSQTSL